MTDDGTRGRGDGGADEPRADDSSADDRRAAEQRAAEQRADERSVIPGPRSFGGVNIASTEAQQTRDHTAARGPGPHDDLGLGDDPPGSAGDDDRRD